MHTQSKILIVDDDKDILTASKLLLKRHVDQVFTCAWPNELSELMQGHQFDAILLDMNFSPGDSSGAEGLYWLKEILKHDPDAVVVMVTAHGGLDIAVEAMKFGATDFIAKPWQNEKLVATLSAAMKLRATRSEAKQLKLSNETLAASSGSSQAMIANSPAMQQVNSLIARAAPTDANVLILGENGTGKELVARAVHAQSTRAAEVFMAIDLGSIAENLFESELFGHQKGSFSGADRDRVGRLQAADKGTLFLDEIGNIPMSLQAKLLTVLEQRQLTPVGSNSSVPFDVRVIAATNVPRDVLYGKSEFREDLLFRLNTVEITLPALKHRRDDIATIANYYASYYAKKYRKPARELSEQAVHAASNYDWPGNVRALRHAVERAVILSEGEFLEAADLQINTSNLESLEKSALVTAQANELQIDEQKTDFNLERLEKNAIQGALQSHAYNISHTAKELGLTRAALYRRMEKHGL
ncbi:MAG: sigma-54-dependent transcriptional regulator [Pseudomonadales bacterium]